MICNSCRKNKAVYDDYYGYLPCEDCRKKQENLKRPGKVPEFTSDSIKEGRKAYFDDYHPAHRKGIASREFREQYGEKAMKRQGFTDKEIKNAKYVWKNGDDSYYNDNN